MIQRERVSENVYSFQSKEYAKVNAGAVIGPEWAILIDTLAYPDETIEIRDFIEKDLNVPVRYVINTHYHADHSWGTCFFPEALVISHSLCRYFLQTKGVKSLEEIRKINPSFRNSQILLPQLTMDDGNLNIRVRKKTLSLIPLPGHSQDGVGVLIKEDRVLFSGDVFMPIPYLVDGNFDSMISTLKNISKIGLENIVQGHGETILRGEVQSTVKDHIAYLFAIKREVRSAARRKYPGDKFSGIDVESCGKSRVIMGGLAEELHQRNLVALYQMLYGIPPKYSEEEK